MASFPPALRWTLQREGVQFDADGKPIPGKTGYVNHPDDPGGETNYGVTREVATDYGYTKSMKDIPYTLVQEIYQRDYWEPVGGEFIADQEIAEELFDTAVNCGITAPVKFLQRTLNVLNAKGTRYPDVTVDGIMGEETLSALDAALKVAPYYRLLILRAIDSLQCVRYIELAERDEKFESFVPGWLRARIGVKD